MQGKPFPYWSSATSPAPLITGERGKSHLNATPSPTSHHLLFFIIIISQLTFHSPFPSFLLPFPIFCLSFLSNFSFIFSSFFFIVLLFLFFLYSFDLHLPPPRSNFPFLSPTMTSSPGLLSPAGKKTRPCRSHARDLTRDTLLWRTSPRKGKGQYSKGRRTKRKRERERARGSGI